MTDLVQIREALEFISGGHTIPGYQGEHSDPRIAICQQVIHGAQTKAKEALVSLKEVADEIERLERALEDRGKVSKEKETP